MEGREDTEDPRAVCRAICDQTRNNEDGREVGPFKYYSVRGDVCVCGDLYREHKAVTRRMLERSHKFGRRMTEEDCDNVVYSLRAGSYNDGGKNVQACTPYTTCQAGQFIKTRGTTSADRTCGKCGRGLYTHDNNDLECVSWRPCGIDEGASDYGNDMHDVKCIPCQKGEVSLTINPFARCTKLVDTDEDGLYDRTGPGYSDSRDAPGTGGEYDKCPNDPDNDRDMDGICGDVDECPKDNRNDKDKDGKCGDKDDVDWTMNFSSNSLIGWKKEGEAFVGQPEFVDAESFEDFAGDTVCPNCFVKSQKAEKGTLISKTFTVKKNSLEFKVGGDPGLTSIEVYLVGDKEDNKIRSVIPSGGDQLYPVLIDMSQHAGEEAYIKVTDESATGSIMIDDVSIYNDKGGCLPECLKIEASICGKGENQKTCFYFENSEDPYVEVRSMSNKKGMYCMSGGRGGSFGAEIGKGLKEFDVRSDYLALGFLPRCLFIEIGSKFGIQVAEDSTQFEFRHSNMPPVNAEVPEAVDGSLYCVYNTLKPYCAALYSPLALFKQQKKANCKEVIPEQNCLDLCYEIHCKTAAPDGKDMCGATKMFDDCANCCARNKNIASGCFRRRRRLSEQVWEVPESKSPSELTESACADMCLKDLECIGFFLRIGEGCLLTHDCSGGPDDEEYARREWWGRKDAAAFAKKSKKKGGKKRRKKKKSL